MTKPTTRARKNLGDSGERVAAMFLEQRGYKILARNWRSPTRVGEMDLIAEDADGLAFVKMRNSITSLISSLPLTLPQSARQ
jgi:putative endonuclease